MSTAATTPAPQSQTGERRKGAALVFCCTILGAGAQMLLKMGANQLAHPSLGAVLLSPQLMGGLSLYGLSTILLVLALRDGELSLLYPVIALTYVWVTMLSFVVFHDRVNPLKIAGISIIVVGVAVLGRSQKT